VSVVAKPWHVNGKKFGKDSGRLSVKRQRVMDAGSSTSPRHDKQRDAER
jgi:hypothetical protein